MKCPDPALCKAGDACAGPCQRHTPPVPTTTTGWPPGMLQDDSRPLSRWLSNRLGSLAGLKYGDITPIKEKS